MSEPTAAEVAIAKRIWFECNAFPGVIDPSPRIAHALTDRYAQGVADERARAVQIVRAWAQREGRYEDRLIAAIERGEAP